MSSTSLTTSDRPCEVRGCTGSLGVYDVVTQHATGDQMVRYECRRNFRHRAWLIVSLGVLHKESAGRWDKPRLG